MSNSISLIAILSLFTLLPFIIASGTYFIKFSIVLLLSKRAGASASAIKYDT